MPARQFPIDKAPLVQPLMRAIFPGTLVDRKFLPANGLACAHPAGPNHVSAHDIETHGIKDFRVVRNFGHRIAPFSPRAQRLGRVRRGLIQLASNRATGSIRADHESHASSRPCAFAATMPQTVDAAHHADRREQGGRRLRPRASVLGSWPVITAMNRFCTRALPRLSRATADSDRTGSPDHGSSRGALATSPRQLASSPYQRSDM